MHCPSCKTDNPPDALFCEQCGSKLEVVCPVCKATISPGARFCKKCGTAIAAISAPATAKKSTYGPIRIADTIATENLEGERKTVTMLFADIKGSMELIEDLDPEEARAIVDPALKLMMEAVQRYGGYVAQSTGDGIFALFGAPVAHEDHPLRALHAALRMQGEVKRYADALRAEKGVNLEVRVGANTGEVVVREIRTGQKHTEYLPIGHSTSVAARLQALASAGSIVITEPVRKLVEGYFALKSLGPARIKGVSEPLEIYEVTGLGPLRTRLQRAAGQGLTKFVGRQREMETLKHAGELAQAGHGQIVAAVAEPGVGKSRLFFEFKAKNQSGWMVLEAFSVSHGKASAYLPVLDLLHTYFKIASEDDARARREKVAGKITILDRSLEDTLPYLFGLFGIVEGEDPLAQTDANLRKRRTLDAIKRILLRESLNQPLIVMFEDLHWIDEQTQEFLNLLADSIANAKILLLVNYRPPEYAHQWGSKTYYTQLRLDPLGKESADEMLSALLGDAPELMALKKLIIERTEGNPFFMEETYQVLLDEGAVVRNGSTIKLTKPIDELKIPPTVQGILAARIDRLAPEAKDLLQTLSVIGRQFPISLICAVVSKSAEELDRMLHNLQLGEFIYEQPAVGDTEYVFKHALTQEVAQNSVLLERRKLMHERIGAAMEALYADRVEDHVAELAHHYARSTNAAKAVEYCLRACNQSSERACYAEAVAYFESGLTRLAVLPDDDRRAELELDLRNAAQYALMTTKGWGSAESEQFILREVELAGRPGVHWEKSWMALYGLYIATTMRSRNGNARELATQMLTIAQQSGNVDFTAESFYCLAFSQMYAGDLEPAAKSFDRATSLFETTTLSIASGKWRRTLVHTQAYAVGAWNAWLLGFADRALKLLHHAFALARASDSKAVEEQAHNLAFWVFFVRREVERMRESAAITVALSAELADPDRQAIGEFFLGWFDSVVQGRADGIARMQRSLADLRSTGSSAFTSYFLSVMAQVQCLFGHRDEALGTISEAVAAVEETGERFAEAEVHRTKGELLLAKGVSNTTQAEQSFRRAIEIARHQKAKSLELRATTSLARLLRDTDRRDEARAVLSEIYNWFTEGFDTADLKEAKALLDELSP
jgi:predicted ATPase/class 3 adenylate cyclase/ribosomal protein L40E